MGDYIRRKRLGAGGFGEVWLARHVGLNVYHAVKFVAAGAVTNPTEFYSEPRLLKALEHRNIVLVYDAGFVSSELYIAMEYLKAGSVEDQCTTEPMKLRRVKPVFCEALKGLQFVHDKGYLHRDLKPANILIDRNGGGKLADFGLAIPIREALLTAPAGTLTYLAPEVFATGEMTKLTDLYAMGVSLYEAANGYTYLPAISQSRVLRDSIVSGDFPDRRYYRSYIPRSLKLVINKAMHPDPTRRYQSADELRQSLEQTTIRCSWDEERGGGQAKWTTHLNDRRLTVALVASSKGWELEVVQRKNSKSAGRRIGRLCGSFQSEEDANRRVREILQGLVCGRALADV